MIVEVKEKNSDWKDSVKIVLETWANKKSLKKRPISNDLIIDTSTRILHNVILERKSACRFVISCGSDSSVIILKTVKKQTKTKQKQKHTNKQSQRENQMFKRVLL